MDRKQKRGEPSDRLDPKAAAADQLFLGALSHHKAGRLTEAEAAYRQILADYPHHVDALHLLGVVAHQQGRNELAIDMIGRAIGLNDMVSGFHNNIGEAYRMLGRLDDAVGHYRRATRLEPGYAEAHMNLGNALKLQHKWTDAEASYGAALALRPDYVEAHMNLGVALMDQGKLDAALERFRRALALKSDFAPAHMNLGIALHQLGKEDDAAAAYRRAIALKPDYTLAHVNLGDLLFDQGKPDEAVASYEQALRASTGGRGPDASVVAPAERLAAFAFNRRLAPVEDKCIMGLVRAQSWRHPVPEWQRICDAALALLGLWPPSQYELLVRKLIHRWIARDYLGMVNTARQAAEADIEIGAAKLAANVNVKNSRAYAKFMRSLREHAVAHPQSRPDQPGTPLPVVGDSHALGFDGTTVTLDGAPFTAQALLVMGCKAWHLANEKRNRFKWLFEAQLAKLESQSVALISIGEIDCRLDEGILPHHRKAGGDIDALVRDLAEKFVAYVAKAAAARGLKLAFLGVPAPHLDALATAHRDATADDRAQLLRIIGTFNRSLEAAAAASGHRFVDLYRVSAAPDGKPSGAQHLDDHHLKPEALALALG